MHSSDRLARDRDSVRPTSACITEEPRIPAIAPSLTYADEDQADDQADDQYVDVPSSQTMTRGRRASTRLVARNALDVQAITGESTAQVLGRCCGGGCCLSLRPKPQGVEYVRLDLPENRAFRSLRLSVDEVPARLSAIPDLPEKTVAIESIRARSRLPSPTDSAISLTLDRDSTTQTASAADQPPSPCLEALADDEVDTTIQPPSFVQPHPPHHVFAAKIHSARELTRPGAEKRTYHFDLDVTDYPAEEEVDFRVGGAIGVMAPNDDDLVDHVMDLLAVPRYLRDKPALLRTTKGRWPTVWGPDKPRCLVTTRRALLTWCSDIQSYAPTKALLRVIAEHASDESEKRLLLYLCSAEGQGSFCDFRTGPHISLSQILSAFPSSQPPLDLLLSVLQPLMPRFYSLSNDPHESFETRDDKQHRLIQIAVTVHETADWRGGCRTGVGSGFFERQAIRLFEATRALKGDQSNDRRGGSGDAGIDTSLFVPMFKGLMANPLAKQFVSDGPMLLIGAGVGIAPFRGFVQRRLKSANCVNKVWVLQGIRDSLVDEIYNGEWGVHEDEVKRVVESRTGEGRYVQEEVRNQADLVWYIINSVDGRVFVCGSTRGMGEGVEEALVEVAMKKGNLERDEARNYWDLKRDVGQYIAETW